MSKLTREDILKLARLSRLRLTEDEIAKFQDELSEILEYVEQLDEVDVSGLEPTYQVTGLKNIDREDEEKSYQASPADLLAQAPNAQANQFKVKRVL